MKTIAQFVQDGIKSTPDLMDALQTAMRLEFSTLPPYLCAEWSIDFNNDPDDVMTMIHGIVIQEMYHFALAGNMLSAIGGKPSVANAAFLTTYPTNTLPGDIHQTLAVDLLPLSPAQLQVFMQIEQPEFPPLGLTAANPPATIAAFYGTISTAFSTVKPAIDLNAHYVAAVGQIKSIDDAVAAIDKIKTEGEGTPKSPDQPTADGGKLAHYYMFKQIYVGKQFVPTANNKWDFVGPQIRFPGVINFVRSPANSDMPAFKQQLATLLGNLDGCWSAGNPPDTGGMSQLQELGMGLIQNGVCPEFVLS
jgi:Ferritin-like